jgi:hypothetical protein
MRSSVGAVTRDAGTGDGYRRRLAALAASELQPGEPIVALLPFATVPKLPRSPERRGRKGKVRFGIRQSWRRYRPLVMTDRRLLVFDSGRTPHPRELIAAFALDDVTIGPVTAGRFGTSLFELSLPGVGEIPFETGRREAQDLAILRAALVSTPPRP